MINIFRNRLYMYIGMHREEVSTYDLHKSLSRIRMYEDVLDKHPPYGAVLLEYKQLRLKVASKLPYYKTDKARGNAAGTLQALDDIISVLEGENT